MNFQQLVSELTKSPTSCYPWVKACDGVVAFWEIRPKLWILCIVLLKKIIRLLYLVFSFSTKEMKGNYLMLGPLKPSHVHEVRVLYIAEKKKLTQYGFIIKT
jgi:hypothetical protein